MPDWLKKLQEKGIEVNKPTLELLTYQLKRIDPSDLRDYNTAVRNFNKTLYKLEEVEGIYFKALRVQSLRVEPAGLEGGMRYRYNEHSQEYYGRIITLRDPEGIVHVFNRGESNRDIASFTSRYIDDYRTQYADRWIRHLREHGYHISGQQFEYYKNQYNEGKALTTKQVRRLREGNSVHGWECTQLTDLILQKSSTCEIALLP
jgi:hypothetical protein